MKVQEFDHVVIGDVFVSVELEAHPQMDDVVDDDGNVVDSRDAADVAELGEAVETVQNHLREIDEREDEWG